MARPSRADRTLLPALLAGLLVAMAAAQFALTGGVALPDAGPIAGPIGGGAREIALADPGSASVAPVIAARPIFAPSGGGGASAGDPAAPTDPLGGTTIAGSVGVGRRGYAMVQTSDGRTLRVPVGGSIAGWRLVALSDNGARLARGGERLTVAYGAAAANEAETPETPQGDQP